MCTHMVPRVDSLTRVCSSFEDDSSVAVLWLENRFLSPLSLISALEEPLISLRGCCLIGPSPPPPPPPHSPPPPPPPPTSSPPSRPPFPVKYCVDLDQCFPYFEMFRQEPVHRTNAAAANTFIWRQVPSLLPAPLPPPFPSPLPFPQLSVRMCMLCMRLVYSYLPSRPH